MAYVHKVRMKISNLHTTFNSLSIEYETKQRIAAKATGVCSNIKKYRRGLAVKAVHGGNKFLQLIFFVSCISRLS